MNPDHFKINGTNSEGEDWEIHCTPEDTELYVHSDKWKEVDHIYQRLEEIDERGRALGNFIWRSILGDDDFRDLAGFMKNTRAYTMVYRPVPSEEDLQTYLRFSSQDIETIED